MTTQPQLEKATREPVKSRSQFNGSQGNFQSDGRRQVSQPLFPATTGDGKRIANPAEALAFARELHAKYRDDGASITFDRAANAWTLRARVAVKAMSGAEAIASGLSQAEILFLSR